MPTYNGPMPSWVILIGPNRWSGCLSCGSLFLGASLLTGERKHIKIDLMSTLLPKRWQPFRELILSLTCVIVMAIMVTASIGYLRLEMEFGGTMFLEIPAWIGQLILPAGFSLILFRFFLQGFDQVMALLKGGPT